MPFPDPARRYPITLPDGTDHKGSVFLNRVIDHPRFQAGDFSYASDFDPPEDWCARLAPYLFDFSKETLRIGRICQIAHGVRFITASANHAMDGLTTFPFPAFDLENRAGYQPDTRDTVIGHDVWIGYGALILPGSRIGSGTIIGAGSVVRGEVPPYSLVTGNPANIVKSRFEPSRIAALMELEWWHWPAEQIAVAEPAPLKGDLDRLKAMAPER
ncbi:CatB-related O-acetyltransferase [Ruegeria sp. 2012CJ41-6]|uniref:CatB-related O-acetyltransferase n=1 Tax=Ruegeria spongiae TaxID=2942209 RepID=A0ABT0Q621_9RHOB|nr:CatB-related O-acetyltransferase [Ruegeria spongiae]MCL6285311.1 CatB-related O-acetyltransferase [Ruegeria spongiae]